MVTKKPPQYEEKGDVEQRWVDDGNASSGINSWKTVLFKVFMVAISKLNFILLTLQKWKEEERKKEQKGEKEERKKEETAKKRLVLVRLGRQQEKVCWFVPDAEQMTSIIKHSTECILTFIFTSDLILQVQTRR